MLLYILKILRCPECRSTLKFQNMEKNKERLFNARLFCKRCNKRYFVKREIGLFDSVFKNLSIIKNFKNEADELSKCGFNKIGCRKKFAEADKRARVFLERTINNFGLKGPIIDIATGWGNFLHYLAGFGKWNIIAIDNNIKTNLSLQSLLLQYRFYGRVSILNADVKKMPIKEQSTDCAICHLGLFLQEPILALQEVGRILKAKGLFIFSHLIFQKNSKTYKAMLKSDLRELNDIQHLNAVLVKAGFKIISLKEIIADFWPGGHKLNIDNPFFKNEPFKGIMIVAQKL